ncbi:MAG: SDR family NAD(P)-dependent oxidoreductase [Spirochaetales bacterium]|nr:SDR family NAD(P)-dependent oxidoreductase [Spirochaetales bacterium]
MKTQKDIIAVVGMACRFPGAENLNQFWKNLEQGINSISVISSDRWDYREYYSPDIKLPNKSISKWCGQVADIDKFDNQFFNISPREANNMDPQQRILLEETWHCIEDCGIRLDELQNGKTAVYVGIMHIDYKSATFGRDIQTDSYACLGNLECILANRISFYYGFHGPSSSINSACASSLVAIHEAKEAILSGKCDFAITAGVNLNLHPWKYISFSKSRMLSPDGQCKTFDKDANGYVPGDGAGVLLLTRLDYAIENCLHIYGLIPGSAVNHCGHSISITAPGVEAQMSVILDCYNDAQIQADTITYIEAHGTGTSLGDPIEIEALSRAFLKHTEKRQFCKIGSLKSNIGHLEGAAGIAGVIKVLLMMKHGKIPETLNINELNPIIPFEETPFSVATEPSNWEAADSTTPLRSGVSSFGFGGSNSHILIESFSRDSFPSPVYPGHHQYIFILSAKNKNSLLELLDSWRKFSQTKLFYDYSLHDICNTLLTGRSTFAYRYGHIVSNKKELITHLNKMSDAGSFTKEENWLLAVGNLEWTGFRELEMGCNRFPLWKDHLDSLLTNVNRTLKITSIVKQFKKIKWPRKYHKLFIFISGYSLVLSLFDMGFHPQLLTGEQNGIWVILAANKMLSIKTIIYALLGKRRRQPRQINKPEIDFYDPAEKRIISSWDFSITYVNTLFTNLSAGEEAVNRNLKKAQLLIENQYTFKKYLGEWDDCLSGAYQIKTEQLILHPGLLKSENNKSILIIIIILYSLKKLNQKWDLKPVYPDKDKRIGELVDLIIDDVLPKEFFIQLLRKGLTGRKEIAEILNKNREKIDKSKPYGLLKEMNNVIGSIDDNWFKKFEKTNCFDNIFAIPRSVEIGTFTSASPLENEHKIQLLSRGKKLNLSPLLNMWLSGIDIRWERIFHNRNSLKISLPLYPFLKNSFWIKEDASKGSVGSPVIEENQSQNNDREENSDNPGLNPCQLYEPVWINENGLDKKDISQTAIVFMEGNAFDEKLLEKIKPYYKQWYMVKEGDEFRENENRFYTINPFNYEDYYTLFYTFSREKLVFKQGTDIYYFKTDPGYLLPAENIAQLDRRMEKVLRGFFYLTKALIKTTGKEKIQILISTTGSCPVVEKDKAPAYINGLLSGFCNTVMAEKSSIEIKIIDFAAYDPDLEHKIDSLLKESRFLPGKGLVAYREKKRYIRSIQKIVSENEELYPGFKDNGVYLIIGGAGVIGLKIIACAVKDISARFFLVGRHPLTIEQEERIQEFRDQGSHITYYQADIGHVSSIESIIAEIVGRNKIINGVIHSAGILDDKMISNKDWDAFKKVLLPKVTGSWVLHNCTKDIPLDFFVCFSSIVSMTGNAGQADYAAANSFIDNFIHYRLRNNFPGHSLAVNWTLWEDGGMGLDPGIVKAFRKKTGLINSDQAFQSLSQLLIKRIAQGIVVNNWPRDVLMIADESSLKNKKNEDTHKQGVTNMMHYNEEVKETLLIFLSELLDIEKDQLDCDTDLNELGIDSIVLTELAEMINEKYNTELNAALLLEYNTISAILSYLTPLIKEKGITECFTDQITTAQTDNPAGYGDSDAINNDENLRKYITSDTSVNHTIGTQRTLSTPHHSLRHDSNVQGTVQHDDTDVAVIGMSGSFPGAENIEEFWQNLYMGTCHISRLEGTGEDDYHPCCGCIKDKDMFAADFFSINREEAESMDPQQRLLLQHMWHTMEDAGYKPSSLPHMDTGVFIGVCNNDYWELLLEHNEVFNLNSVKGSYFSIIANRLSFFFNLKGPSIAIDTACSSSLVAVYEAVKALRNGECRLAFVGGINLCSSKKRFQAFENAGLLSPDGKCSPFDEKANGYVRSEGAGILMLKSLKDAILDKDRIYGLIKGCGINHCGSSNTLTTPSPIAQYELLLDTYTKAGIDPQSIGYIEAHATGTTIGDSIEVNALKKAFRAPGEGSGQNTGREKHCTLGSVKGNIGHLEAASGIAGIIKVLLAMKNKVKPATYNFTQLNKAINLEGSPFIITNKNQEWETIRINNQPVPRRGSVSSFGFGGTNAHIIMEEFVENRQVMEKKGNTPCLFIFSAKSRAALLKIVENCITFVRENESLFEKGNLFHNIAYTLQTGREEMPERLAFAAADREELLRCLDHFKYGRVSRDGMFYGRDVKTKASLVIEDETIEQIHTVSELGNVAARWVQGYRINWELLPHNSGAVKISLPLYPFVKQRYWFSDGKSTQTGINREGEYKKEICSVFVQKISEITGVDPGAIDLEDEDSLKLDSVEVTAFTEWINTRFKLEISPALYFEYPGVSLFIRHIVDDYYSVLAPYCTIIHDTDQSREKITNQEKEPLQAEPVAIIGIHGILPQSEDLEEFWQHLEKGDDVITEIPADRWDWHDYFGDPDMDSCVTDIIWGGFMKDVAMFDASFFGISPREAGLMDPQQRILLQVIWKAFEDSGHKMSDFSATKTGVFIAVSGSDYSDLLKAAVDDIDAHTATGSAQSIISNRISYLFNFHGPSESIDTACSGSLVALHRAIQSLRNGDCETAIVGAVTVLANPRIYIAYSKAGMLSKNGKCRTFDKEADGYVRGEGAGAIILKPLRKAIEEKDHIYAVVKGSAVNHGGKANSLTAPNPNAQAEVIINAYEKAGIDPGTVSYIETHGTGTVLGDPVEINGLKLAFRHLFEKWNKPIPEEPLCGLGALKPYIGHLEAAAGMAGIFKILLSMKHKTLIPTINFRTLNPAIRLEDSPFYILSAKKDWDCLLSSRGNPLPRRAGISSFGFGGVNAHVVLEEFENTGLSPGHYVDEQKNSNRSYIFPFSAKDIEALNRYIRVFHAFLDMRGPFSTGMMENMAYTFQTGREEMKERIAVIASSFGELKIIIRKIMNGDTDKRIFSVARLLTGPDNHIDKKTISESGLKELINTKNFDEIAGLWVNGTIIDWKLFYRGRNPGRISLPTYSFSRERHWLADIFSVLKNTRHSSRPGFSKKRGGSRNINQERNQTKKSQHLLSCDHSGLDNSTYSAHIDWDKFYVSDHIIEDNKMVPAAFYIEMVKAVGELAYGKKVTKIENITFLRPIVEKSNVPVRIETLLRRNNGSTGFKIISNNNPDSLHSKGKFYFDYAGHAIKDRKSVAIKDIKTRCSREMPVDEYYTLLEKAGYKYGDNFRVIKSLYYNDNESFSELAVFPAEYSEQDRMLLPLTLIDGAFQTAIVLLGQEQENDKRIYFPFSIDDIHILDNAGEGRYAHVEAIADKNRPNDSVKIFLIKLLNSSGQVICEFNRFTFARSMKTVKEEAGLKKLEGLLLELVNGEISEEKVEERIGDIYERSELFTQ